MRKGGTLAHRAITELVSPLGSLVLILASEAQTLRNEVDSQWTQDHTLASLIRLFHCPAIFPKA